MNNTIFELAEYELPVATETRTRDWVEYGVDNNYFNFLIDRYNLSTTNSAIINNVARLVYGRGLSALDSNRKPNDYARMLTMFPKDDIRKLILDRKILGQGALQIHYSKNKKEILKALHIPVHLLRAEKCDEEGEINNYFYSDDWSDTRKFVPKAIPVFGKGGKNDLIEILYIKPYSVGQKYYSKVDYIGALPYALLEEEIGEYLINDVQNGFSGTKVVNFNNGEATDEEQKVITSKVKKQLTGSKGTKVIVSFNDNVESRTTVEDISLNDATKHYEYLAEECMRKIMLGHTVTSPLIFGISSSNGFSSNADELKNSIILYDNMVVKPMQDEILDALDALLVYNNITLKTYFKTLQPLEFTDLENANSKEQIEEETGVEMSEHSVLNDILKEVDNNKLGEEWKIVDERDSSDDEEQLNAELEAKEESFYKLSRIDKVMNFVKGGTAKPNFKSEQDKEVKNKFFRVRYRYVGNATPDRDFCKVMMSKKDRLFRKEDIDKMSSQVVNKGFGENGADKYDIFKFKGGARCNHSWKRVTFMLDLNATGKGYSQIGTRSAEIKGYKVTNPYQVSVKPKNLPLKGFSPNNKNLPNDVK